MNNSEIALKLVMDELGVEPKELTLFTPENTVEWSHKTVQLAIYLAQAAGVPLSYSYRWY